MCPWHNDLHEGMHFCHRSDELNDALDDAKAKNKALPSKKNGVHLEPDDNLCTGSRVQGIMDPVFIWLYLEGILCIIPTVQNLHA